MVRQITGRFIAALNPLAMTAALITGLIAGSQLAGLLPISRGSLVSAAPPAGAAARDQKAPGEITQAIQTEPAAVTSAAAVTPPPACTPAAAVSPGPLNLFHAAPGVHYQLDRSYYTIHGNTPEQLKNQLEACGPRNNAGEGYSAMTSYYISWYFDYEFSQDKSLCSLKDIAVGANVSQVLPQWSAAASAEPGLEARWLNAAGHLAEHENRHAELAKAGAERILSILSGLPSGDCRLIGQTAAELGRNALAALAAENRAYDAATNHGATEGTVL